MSTITATDAADMVRHWLGTPPAGYLGSEEYGSEVKALLQTPLAAGLANDMIAKARRDIPLLGLLPGDALNLYATTAAPDRMNIVFELAGQEIPVGVAQ